MSEAELDQIRVDLAKWASAFAEDINDQVVPQMQRLQGSLAAWARKMVNDLTDAGLLTPQDISLQEPDPVPNWDLVEMMVGDPDYAVVFAVWPWPDGGWKAGIVLTDQEWADEQELPAGIRALEVDFMATWDVTDGFVNGINMMGSHAAEAIDLLWLAVQ